MPRVVAIGIDAAEWDLVSRYIDEGNMPNLARLRDSAARCRLRNVVEYRSELPWTQFVTGRDAPSNRYWSTVRFEPSTYEAFEQGAHHGKPFYAWDEDAFVIAFDIPHSTIRSDVRGVQITGWGAHSPQYPRAASPRGLLDEIDARFGPHPAFDNDYHGGWFQPGFVESLANALIEGARRRVDVDLWLMERFPDWDVFVTVMSESHSAGHHFWHGVDESHPLYGSVTGELAASCLRDVYQAIDAELGRLIDHLPVDTELVVFSVHGMQPNENDVPSLVILPELLHQLHGRRPLMQSFRQRSGRGAIVPAPDRMWASYMHEHFAETTSERLRRAVRLNTPSSVLHAKRRLQSRLTGRTTINGQEFAPSVTAETDLSPEEIQHSYHNDLRWQIPVWYQKYWPTMKYFALPTFSDGKIRINLAGRERDGMVPVADYLATLDALEVELRACRDIRTGAPVVADVFRLRETDPLDPNGPDADLVVLWASPIDGIDHPATGRIGPFPFLRTGEHSSNGFAFIRSSRMPATDLGERSAFDITPTIVELSGHAMARGFVGESMVASVPH